MEINWKQDYDKDFICPKCEQSSLGLGGFCNGKRQFRCLNCKKIQLESCETRIKAVLDPINPGLTWYKNHKIKHFVCPECESENIYFASIYYGKKRFCCRSCKKYINDSTELSRKVISRFNGTEPVKLFDFNTDKWDIRAINPGLDNKIYKIINFTDINQDWFKKEIKKYIHYLCKKETPLGTIQNRLSALRFFSKYIDRININSFNQINRSVILNYLSELKNITKNKIGGLRDFFLTGTVRGWFSIEQDIIRDEDYPKRRESNPDPLSDFVREQIEQNLHKLPDPIARMWIICFFTAMRPGELARLKQDCLVQEGEYWKLVWKRPKSNDYHAVPISRTIAKVVQAQLTYIHNLWGQNWNYLFCHYHGLSRESLSRIDLKPVRKTLPQTSNPLTVCIRTLIKDLDIRDENGQPAKFKTKILRTTRLTQLFEQGHDLAVVSAWAGHKHFATTSTYYTKVSCDLIEQEAGHIQKALVNSEGHRVPYESFPKSFWEKPQAHKLELSGTHINTPIYGYCGLDLDQDCHKFRACYTCGNFVATPEKLPQYIKTRDELRGKQSKALTAGQDVLVEQFGSQADRLDKIIASLQEAA